ncbi:hypothetical protein BRX37_21325 [Sphingomonas sp. S-NIH.Pt3_0716]|nr:hypothetical protein BRX37_21325 [Sphingomonas sp. S-NIH.Pt3_0716]
MLGSSVRACGGSGGRTIGGLEIGDLAFRTVHRCVERREFLLQGGGLADRLIDRLLHAFEIGGDIIDLPDRGVGLLTSRFGLRRSIGGSSARLFVSDIQQQR